jgi:hypothetical protein
MMEEAAFALNALKRRKDDKRRKFIAKEFHDSILGKDSTWLDEAKKANGGKLPQGKILEVTQDLAGHGVHMTWDILNKLVVKQWALEQQGTIMMTPLPITDITVEIQTNVSSLIYRCRNERWGSSERQYKG